MYNTSSYTIFHIFFCDFRDTQTNIQNMLFITKLVIIFKFHEVLQSLIRIFNQIEKKLCKGRLQVFQMHIFPYFSIQLDFIQNFLF